MKLLNIRFVSIMWLFIVVAASCTDNRKSTALLQQAMEIMEKEPKQALALLDSIREPETLDKDSYMKYIVANVQAKARCYKEVANDTLIFEAQKYFENKEDHKQAALANYYIGIIHYERKDNVKELSSYLKAKRYANIAHDSLLVAKSLHSIAQVYSEQDLDSLAIKYYKEALHKYDKIDYTTDYKLHILKQLGLAYYAKDALDDAELYYRTGLKLANIDENAAYRTMFTRFLGFTFREMGYYNKSNYYLREALKTSITAKDSLETYLNLAKLYNVTNQLDSAKRCTELLEQGLTTVKDKYVLSSMYGALTDYNLQSGNTHEAKHYNDLWHEVNEQITDSNSAARLLEAAEQHRHELQQKEQKAGETRMIFCIIILALCIVVILLLGYQKYRKMRTIEQQKASEIKLLESENELLNEKLDSFAFLQNIVLDVIKNWSRIDCQVKELAVEYGATEEPTIYKEISAMIEDLRNKTSAELVEWAKEYVRKQVDSGKISKKLKDKDFLLLMLCLLGYSKADIAIILRTHQSRIHPRKLDIQRSLKEIGLPDKKIEAMLFL